MFRDESCEMLTGSSEDTLMPSLSLPTIGADKMWAEIVKGDEAGLLEGRCVALN